MARKCKALFSGEEKEKISRVVSNGMLLPETSTAP